MLILPTVPLNAACGDGQSLGLEVLEDFPVPEEDEPEEDEPEEDESEEDEEPEEPESDEEVEELDEPESDPDELLSPDDEPLDLAVSLDELLSAVLVDLARLSVLKKPDPLKLTPTGWNTFFTGITTPDSGCANSDSVSSLNDC